jgi:prepilin-type N-terminal cleavage/methylation domain-containing protein
MGKTVREGFTLIELLVVIAIIAILAALLMPALERARQRAMETVCMSNFKQFGLGLRIYADTYDGFMPCGKYNTNSNSINYGGAYYLAEFGVTAGVVTCPENPEAVPTRRYQLGSQIWPGGPSDKINLPYIYTGGCGGYPDLWDSGAPHCGTDSDGDPWWGWRIGRFPLRNDGIRPTPKFSMNKSGCPISWDVGWTGSTDPATVPDLDFAVERSNHPDDDGFSARGRNLLFVGLNVEWRSLDYGVGTERFFLNGRDYYW